jgi:nanoRNase/pAp phosphatase (c-di-AMP/oligoRNAs hydrolase)
MTRMRWSEDSDADRHHACDAVDTADDINKKIKKSQDLSPMRYKIRVLHHSPSGRKAAKMAWWVTSSPAICELVAIRLP